MAHRFLSLPVTLTLLSLQTRSWICSLPDDSFVRSNGSADGHQLLGVFRGKKTGPCRMYVELDESPVLSIQTDEYTVFLTAPTKMQAENWYQELKDHMFDN